MPAAPPDEEPRAAPLPVDELVRDLESGTTLEELRRELHESQTRMMEADDALKHDKRRGARPGRPKEPEGWLPAPSLVQRVSCVLTCPPARPRVAHGRPSEAG